jgi:hypothetical protein
MDVTGCSDGVVVVKLDRELTGTKTNMTFFITSAGSGKGADLGGLAGSWNSSHPSRGTGAIGGCSQEGLCSSGGNGLFYCFAVN